MRLRRAKFIDCYADMKKVMTACAITTTGIRGLLERNNRFIAAASIVCFVTGIALSHRIEPGVRVQKVMLAEETPALEFLPAGPGPHPVALLAHGATGSKETLFRNGEALAAAGFICYDVDLPGHGASPRTYTFVDTVHTLEAVAREVGPVDVFVGHSMGGFTGGEAVREGGMKPGLFIAVGSLPVLGDHAPPLLLLAGRFDEAIMRRHITPASLKTRTDARVVISPWSDHLFELWDPLLVNAAVQAACAAVHATPPPAPAAWCWRLLGIALAFLGAATLALYLPELFPQLARVRGPLFAVLFVVSFTLTIGYAWIDAAPHLRFFPKQGIAMAVTFLLATVAGKLRVPRWSFPVLGVLAMVIAFCWLKRSGSFPALLFTLLTFACTLALIAGTAISWIAARRGSRLQGDIAMAIIVGCAAFQWAERPPMAPEAPPKPPLAIKLDAKLLDAFVGQYDFPPDNLFWLEWKLRISRQGDQLIGQSVIKNQSYPAFDIYPGSETNFFRTNSLLQYTFVKDDQGETLAVILHRGQGLPGSEGKKLKNE